METPARMRTNPLDLPMTQPPGGAGHRPRGVAGGARPVERRTQRHASIRACLRPRLKAAGSAFSSPVLPLGLPRAGIIRAAAPLDLGSSQVALAGVGICKN